MRRWEDEKQEGDGSIFRHEKCYVILHFGSPGKNCDTQRKCGSVLQCFIQLLPSDGRRGNS